MNTHTPKHPPPKQQQQQHRPPKIRPLPKEVVDRIAAGEVVQRPVSVVKELLENSLDADATTIDIQCVRGGLDSITVTDDGFGMSPRDLPLAATRFATSKLVDVEDLKSIRTFGFRGEALASASMVGRVSIVSRMRARKQQQQQQSQGCHGGDDDDDDDEERISKCAYKMQYKDGQPMQAQGSNSNNNNNNNNSANPPKPKPSAGREGTVVQIQDLFYNIPSRRRAMEGRRKESEEYDRILAVVQRYAVHEAGRGVAFLCRGGNGAGGGGVGGTKMKKGGAMSGNHTDLNTQSLASVKKLQERRKRARSRVLAASDQSSLEHNLEDGQFAATKDVIGHIFGSAVARELLPLKAGEGDVDAVSVAALKAMAVKHLSGKTFNNSPMSNNDDSNKQQTSSLAGDVKEMSNVSNNDLMEEMMMGENNAISLSETPNKSNDNKNKNMSQSTHPSKFAFAYKATGLITNGSYSAPKNASAFLLFINDRLVESSSLRRSVESIYSDTLPKGGKPFVYISLELPGPHIDVNVHPTKREVAFLHEDRLCDAVAAAVKEVIGSATSSRTFVMAAPGAIMLSQEERRMKKALKVTAAEEKAALDSEEVNQGASAEDESTVVDGEKQPATSDKAINVDDDMVESTTLEQNKCEEKKTPKKRPADESKQPSTTKKPYYDPSRLVRTDLALPVGALEPFLVKKQSAQQSSEAVAPGAKGTSQVAGSVATLFQHAEGCEFANSQKEVDMSLPGAFASAICRCQVERSETLPAISNSAVLVNNTKNNVTVKPKKITPTECDYESICNLRKDISTENYQWLNETLRGSIYVGAVSRSRSLIQCGIDLFMINHRELAQEMFYQLALIRFKGNSIATLGGGGVDVMSAISRMLQFEEELNSANSNGDPLTSKVNKTNADLARQATSCLGEKSPMLEEYFSIKFEQRKVRNMQGKEISALYLTGLPIFLDGHAPQPHALPLFLMRLATEVNWTEENSCFKGICRELASFYAEPPVASSAKSNNATGHDEVSTKEPMNPSGDDENPDFIDDEAKKYVKHILFPAISFLLVPPKRFSSNGTVLKLANLTSLYKVFERC